MSESKSGNHTLAAGDVPQMSDDLSRLSKEELVMMVMRLTSSAEGNNKVDTEGSETESILGDFVKPKKIYLDGNTLTPEELVAIGYDPTIIVDLAPSAWVRVQRSRQIVDNILARKETVYGINTGFGNFANVIISSDQLRALQENLVRSHAAGVGRPLAVQSARMLLALRLNVLAKGHSGIRPETIRTMLACLAHNCISYVPCQGTVGASGDLAPLSHLALGIMGEGKMWNPETKEWGQASVILAKHGIEPVQLQAKEGLALINGTQLITCLGAEAVVRAKRVARQADVVAGLTLEALKGSTTSFHPYIHQARPHRGQGLVAGRLRNLLNWNKGKSEIAESHRNCSKVQDSYTLRCVPQIHGVVHETIQFVYTILLTEMNSATDNPMVFPNASRTDVNTFTREKFDDVERIEMHHKELTKQLLRGEKPDVEHVDASLPNSLCPSPLPLRSSVSDPTSFETFPSSTSSPHLQMGSDTLRVHLIHSSSSSSPANEGGMQRSFSNDAATPTVAHPPAPAAAASSSSADRSSSSSSSTSTSTSTAAAANVASVGVVCASAVARASMGEPPCCGLSVPETSSRCCPCPVPMSPSGDASHDKLYGTGCSADAANGNGNALCAVASVAAGGEDEVQTRQRGLTDHEMQEGVILSGGNFHGEYPAKALDYLAIGIHELASVAERRIERLVNPQLSGLPAFLVKAGGLNSGFMIAHCTAAALVSENKVLCHPSSVDSLSTSAAQEDHVSMGGFAARKALDVVKHVEYVVAIELLCACQALDMLRPLKTTPQLEAVHAVVREHIKTWDQDRHMSPDIEVAHRLIYEEKVWTAVKAFVEPKFHNYIPSSK